MPSVMVTYCFRLPGWIPNGCNTKKKEYGKLTADQFKEFIGKLPEPNRQRSEFGQLLADLPKEKFNKLMEWF